MKIKKIFPLLPVFTLISLVGCAGGEPVYVMPAGPGFPPPPAPFFGGPGGPGFTPPPGPGYAPPPPGP